MFYVILFRIYPVKFSTLKPSTLKLFLCWFIWEIPSLNLKSWTVYSEWNIVILCKRYTVWVSAMKLVILCWSFPDCVLEVTYFKFDRCTGILTFSWYYWDTSRLRLSCFHQYIPSFAYKPRKLTYLKFSWFPHKVTEKLYNIYLDEFRPDNCEFSAESIKP